MYLRRALAPVKKLAVVLHWLAQASSFYVLAALYAILRERLVHNSILFPTGTELEQVMLDLLEFES